MTLLPSQKLTIGELFVSLAAGLMLYLLPNDAKKQFESEAICIGFVFLISLVIIVAMFIIIKRYEAIGTALMTLSSLQLLNIVISVISGIASRGSEYWHNLTEYNIICMFAFALATRLLTNEAADSNDLRRSFIRFMSLSMGSLLIIYGIILILKMIIPIPPSAMYCWARQIW